MESLWMPIRQQCLVQVRQSCCNRAPVAAAAHNQYADSLSQ